MIYENPLGLIGNTPVVRLNNLVSKDKANVYLKLEKFNINGSVKDRAALYMIKDAMAKNLLKKDSIILEPTSGNTGIALAMIGRLLGFSVCIIMPESMSKERRDLIAAYGAKLILTPAKDGMKGAINKANELAKNDNRYYIAQQFNNEANKLAHYETTASEIIKDFDKLDYFIAGVGTGGSISGIGKRLKEHYKNIKIIALEPKSSAVLSGNEPSSHKIQGIGAGFIPNNYDKNYIDEIIQISDEDAYLYTKKLALEEGLFLGISSGASAYAAINLANQLDKNTKILALAPDSGDKYISTGVFDV